MAARPMVARASHQPLWKSSQIPGSEKIDRDLRNWWNRLPVLLMQAALLFLHVHFEGAKLTVTYSRCCYLLLVRSGTDWLTDWLNDWLAGWTSGNIITRLDIDPRPKPQSSLTGTQRGCSRIWVPEPPNCTQNHPICHFRMPTKYTERRSWAPRYSRSPCYTAP